MNDLSVHHINSLTGKEKWSKRSIQKMLTNEKYIGNVILGKIYTGDFPNNKQKINHGEQKQFFVKEAHTPIITKEMFEVVQEEMKRRSNMGMVDEKTQRKAHTIVQRS